jgi:hypothetical protein
MQKAPGQLDQGQVDLKRGPWGYGGPCMLRYRSRAVEVPLGSQKIREEAQTAHATQKAVAGLRSAAGDVRLRYKKPLIWEVSGRPGAGVIGSEEAKPQ